jgi:hypothetical protein
VCKLLCLLFLRAFGAAIKRQAFFFPFMGSNVDKSIGNKQLAIGKASRITACSIEGKLIPVGE